MSYLLMKFSHNLLALLSISGFVVRWYWMKQGSPLFRHRLTRILPHIVDTLFLVFGLLLAQRIFQYPFANDWLTAKLIGLVLYIVLGSFALKYGRTPQIKTAAFIGALVTFAWIVSVAMSKNAAGFFAFLFNA